MLSPQQAHTLVSIPNSRQQPRALAAEDNLRVATQDDLLDRWALIVGGLDHHQKRTFFDGRLELGNLAVRH